MIGVNRKLSLALYGCACGDCSIYIENIHRARRRQNELENFYRLKKWRKKWREYTQANRPTASDRARALNILLKRGSLLGALSRAFGLNHSA